MKDTHNIPNEEPEVLQVPQIDEIDQTERASRPGTVTDRNKLSLLEDPFLNPPQMKEVEKITYETLAEFTNKEAKIEPL